MTLAPKLLSAEANLALGMVGLEGHVHTLTHVCIAYASDLSKPFGKLIDRQLTNLMVGSMVDGDY